MALNLWIMGSGTLRPDPHRGSPGYWIEAEGARILMDCGAGTLQKLASHGRDWAGLTHVLLSHFHTDHVGELAPLLFALKHASDPPRRDPLVIMGPAGLEGFLSALAQAHGNFVLHPGFALHLVELAPGRSWMHPDGCFRLFSHQTPHTTDSLAFRLETDGTVLGYTGDTGPDPGVGDFLAGAQVVLAECSHTDANAVPNHLSPRSLAALADEARPGVLIPIHVYPPLVPEGLPELLSKEGYWGRVVPGEDGMVVTISRGGVEIQRP